MFPKASRTAWATAETGFHSANVCSGPGSASARTRVLAMVIGMMTMNEALLKTSRLETFSERVLGVVCAAGLAPFRAQGLDWFAGMAPAGAADLRAAARGRAALEDHLVSTEFDSEQFIPADHAALAGPWSWLGQVAGQALEGGMGGMVDDDLAYVAPWGFDPARVRVPVLLVHGGQDRIAPSAHARWLASRIPSAELWLRPDDGHISVLQSAEAAVGWLWERREPAP
jgi:pimeloyl-ACP methyl ester carboxylesterase